MRRTLSFPLVLGLALATLLIAACGHEPEPEPTAALAPSFQAPPSEVGAELCLDCHEEIVQAYAESAMARALGPVSPAELTELAALPATASASGFDYTIFPTPGGQAFVVGETRPASPGYAMGTEILFGIGAGVRDRSLAVRRGSSMFFAPLEILSLPGGRATALSPAEMMQPGQRFGFPLSPECLGCHTDAPPPLTYPLNLAPPGYVPRGISCAGCHGSAATLEVHVAFQEGDLAGEGPSGSDPLLRLAELGRFERLSICAACHLQGDARIELASGRLGSFALGRDIMTERAIFVGAETTDEVGFVSQTERLALSACFQKSELDCTTCHNPHRALAGSERETSKTRAACAACHNGREGAPRDCARTPRETDGDCATCHMPTTGVFDVAAVTIHDHYIRTHPEPMPASHPKALRFAEAPDGAWRRFTWPGEPPPESLNDLGLWMMAYAGGGLIAEANELVDQPPGRVARELAMYHHVRASLLEGLGRSEDAETEYGLALELDPALGISATNLGLLLMKRGRPDVGLATLDQLLATYPLAAGALRNRALVRRELGDQAGFRSDLERAFQLAPTSELARLLAAAFGPGEPSPDATKAQRYAALDHELDPR
jgi:hypothetical protein